ncbi:MAG: DUF1838 family protein [Pseudomonadota bacterium]
MTMNQSDLVSPDRRSLLGVAGLGFAAGVSGAWTEPLAAAEFADSPDLQDPWMREPEQAFRNFLRVQGDLSGLIAPQWWRGAYLAIYPDRNPELLFRMEGCEMKRIVDLGGGRYEFQYQIFTSMKDPVTNETLNGKRWRNPITGKELTVEPNSSAANRTVSLSDRGIVETREGRDFEAVIHSFWTAQGPFAMHAGFKDRPSKRPLPLKAFATSFFDRAAAADFNAPRLDVRFCTNFIAPFQRWMEMPQDAGHAVWHASGHKARDVASLPESYMKELMAYKPEMTDWIGKDGKA